MMIEDSVRKVTIIEAPNTPKLIVIIASFRVNPKTLANIPPVKAPVPGSGVAINIVREKTSP